MYYLGIDGQGRYTKLLIMDENNKVLGRHSGLPCDLRLQPAASAAHNITVLVKEMNRLTNTAIKDCGGLCFAAPEETRTNHEAALVRMFKTIGFTCSIRVVCVERAALTAKIGDSPGILLLAGDDVTGYVHRGNNNDMFFGGYGRLIETGGSVYSIGLMALRSVVASMDGRSQPTALKTALTRHMSMKEVSDIIKIVNSPHFEVNRIHEWAALVNEAALAGDAAALDIEARASRELSAFGCALIESSGLSGDRVHMVLGGAVILLTENIQRQVSANIRKSFSNVQIHTADEKTELGAAMLAKKE